MKCLEITPLNYLIGNCFLSAIATLTNRVRVNYELILGSCWNFHYKDQFNQKYMADRIESFDEGEIKRILNHLYGIEYFWHSKDNIDDTVKIISDQIDHNKPVGFNINTFWCPWSPLYQKDNGYHFFLVIGFEEKALYCVDNISRNVERIGLDDFTNGYGNYILFHYDMDSNIRFDYKYMIDFIIKKYNANEMNTTFKNIRKFAGELSRIDFRAEISGFTTLEAVPLYAKLKYIEDGRNSFSIFLKFIGERCGDATCFEFSKKLDQAGKMWGNIKYWLIKMAYTDNYQMLSENICNKLAELADYEENIFNELMSFFSIDRFQSL